MRSTVLLVLLILGSSAAADTLRMKFRASTGELVTTAKSCGKQIRTEVWRHLAKGLYVQIAGDEMLVAAGPDKERVADRVVSGEPFVGFFDRTPQQTIAVFVRRDSVRKGWVNVELAIIVRDPDKRGDACSEKWSGLASLL